MAIITLAPDALRRHARKWTVLSNIFWLLLVAILAAASVIESFRVIEVGGLLLAFIAALVAIPVLIATIALNHHAHRWPQTEAAKHWNFAISFVAVISLALLLVLAVAWHWPSFYEVQAVFTSVVAAIKAGGGVDALWQIVRATELTLTNALSLVLVGFALLYAIYDLLFGNSKAMEGTSLRQGEVADLDAEVTRLKAALQLSETEKAELQSRLNVIERELNTLRGSGRDAVAPRTSALSVVSHAPGASPTGPIMGGEPFHMSGGNFINMPVSDGAHVTIELHEDRGPTIRTIPNAADATSGP